MKTIVLLTVILLQFLNSKAQDNTLLNTFNNQIEAFNSKDVDQLTANVSENFKWFYLTADTLMLEVSGKENFRAAMEGYFKAYPTVISKIDKQLVIGNRVSFNEVVEWQGKSEKQSQSAMGIYEIKDGLITRAWYFLD